MFRENLEQVESRIHNAAHRAGRRREDITLVAVSKVFPAAAIREAWACGVRDFGENYVQEIESKLPDLHDLGGARFHLIGHLQSNKSRRAAEIFHVIQTVDSGKLARRLNEYGKPIQVMVEVNLSGEASKSGVPPDEVQALCGAVQSCPNLVLLGLMTMPPWFDDPEDARPYFRRLGGLAARLELPCLSMGMSSDFEVAIEEGATHIRIGTALFGKRRRQ